MTEATKTAYQRRKDRARATQAAQAATGQDIGAIPPIADPGRKAAGRRSFRVFCETYFPDIFYLPWSPDHLRAIEKIERAVTRGRLYAFAMPRGSGKTVLCMVCCIWATLTGWRHFVSLIIASAERSVELLGLIKTVLETNGTLQADFPEALHPVQQLGRIVNRQKGQKYNGQPTRIEWNADKIVFATIPGSPASGAIITACGMKGSDIRGQVHVLPDGWAIRPDLAVCDDPQTRETAYSNTECMKREATLAGDVLGMAGPGKYIAALLPCTVIRKGDVADNILDRERHPDWQGVRTKMVYSFPANEKLWDEYAQIRADSLKGDGDGSQATEFYRQHRQEMDAGAKVAWPERHDPKELSGIQHAMNLRFRDEPAFFAEYQNEPMVEQADETALSADDAAAKVNGRKRGEIPAGCDHVTAFIDVHDKLLFYAVSAWEDDFTGYVVDYGTFPDQGRAYFGARNATRTLGRKFQGAGKEGAITAGLTALLDILLGREWRREDGSIAHVGRCLIDAGYEADTIHSAIRACPGAALITPSLGQGITAANKPISEYNRKRGDRIGFYWWIPGARRRRLLRTVHIDTNYWKTFVHTRLAVALGDKGCLSLFGKKPADHRLFAEHATAEYRVATEGRGRRVDEWKQPPSKPDNHWFDCLVGCAAAASMLGVSLPGTVAQGPRKPKRQRKRVAYLNG